MSENWERCVPELGAIYPDTKPRNMSKKEEERIQVKADPIILARTPDGYPENNLTAKQIVDNANLNKPQERDMNWWLDMMRREGRINEIDTPLHTPRKVEPSPIQEQIKESLQRRKEDKGLRYDKGKIRFDLLEPFAIEELAKVFTKGAAKYDDNNWLKGMKWSKMRASLGRHLAAYDKCQDYDIDPTCDQCKAGTCVNHTGLLHIAQVAWNAMALLSYYKHFPQGDDRYRRVQPKIALDLDEVVVNWVGAWCEKHGMETPEDWYFHRDLPERFEQMKASGELDNFYLNLGPLIEPKDIKFDIDCYVTSRPVDSKITEQWLDKYGFPARPVVTVPVGTSKLQTLRDNGVEWFIDDNYKTYCELNANGIMCFLMDQKHNRRFDVGYKRILSFQDFYDRFLK